MNKNKEENASMDLWNDTDNWRFVLYYCLMLLIVLITYKNEIALTIALAIGFAFLLYLYALKHYIIVFLIVILGPLVEIMCVLSGVWQYTVTSVLVIPLWLFFAWGQAGIFIVVLNEKIKQYQ